MAIVLRSEKGAPLLASEIDGNFSFLLDQITALQAGVVAEGIASVSIDADGITFVGTLGTTWGPIAIPIALRAKGEWQSGEVYVRNDLVQNGSDLYLVLQPHTSSDFATDVELGNLALAYTGPTDDGSGGLPEPIAPVSGIQHVLKYDDEDAAPVWGLVDPGEINISRIDTVNGGLITESLAATISKILVKIGGI